MRRCRAASDRLGPAWQKRKEAGVPKAEARFLLGKSAFPQPVLMGGAPGFAGSGFYSITMPKLYSRLVTSG